MTALRRARGFTLLELFVVILVIAILLGLLLPAIRSGGGGQRNTCANNMRLVGIALQMYHDRARQFPGYANVVNGKRASWVVPLLPYFERSDLYAIWAHAPTTELPLPAGSNRQLLGSGQAIDPWAFGRLNELVCPSDLEADAHQDPLSYVVNCGSARTINDFMPAVGNRNLWVEDRNSGVFFNRARADFTLGRSVANPPADSFAPDEGPVVTLDFIAAHDGTSQTLLLSENLQAGTWATDPTDQQHDPPGPFQSEFQIKQNTGFVWYVVGTTNNTLNAGCVKIISPAHRINAVPDGNVPAPPTDPAPPGDGLLYARPSSRHPGGVNVIFCDGHLRFLAEDIDYRVYTQLMTPHGKDAIISVDGARAADQGWDYELSESDY